MANGFSQYQQSQLGVSAAKARAISERSMAQFDLGVSALQEKEALQEAVDRLEQIAKDADRNAKRRGRKVSFGRLIGSIAGFAIGGPAGKAALGTALGSLAGSAAAGGFKKYGVEVDDSLVPGGIFYGRNREALKNRIDDLQEATKDLTRAQRQGIAKDTITSFLLGRGLGKLGKELEPLVEAKAIDNVDYLKNVFRKSLDLDYTDNVDKLLKETSGLVLGGDGRFQEALGPRLSTDIMEQAKQLTKAVDPATEETKKAFKVFQSTQQVAPALQQNRTMQDALNRERNVLMGSPSGSNLADTVRNLGGGKKVSILPVSNEVRDYTQVFDPMVEMGLMTNRQVDDFFDNPDSLANELDVLFGNRSRPLSNRNALFQQSVGPMRGL